MKKKVTIVGPMYNEEGLVSQYCSETLDTLSVILDSYDIELILVDDGSKDNTLSEMIKSQSIYPDSISVVQLTRNFGLEGAIYAGLRSSDGDAVVVMDADLQDPPSVILQMIREWEAGADIVVGSRVGRPNDTLFKKISAKAFYSLLNVFSGKVKLEKEAANFRLLDRRALDKLLSLPEVNGVFRVLVPFIGMKTAVVEYERDKRHAGTTKYNFSSMMRYALDSITGISIEPLRKVPIAAIISLLITFSGLISLIFCSQSWTPTLLVITAVSFQISLLLAALTVMAEYLGQIYLEAKHRPISLIHNFIPANNRGTKKDD